MDDQVRELLRRRADDVPPHREVPRALASRSRRRIARNALGRSVVVVALVAAAFAGVRALGGFHTAQPAGITSVSPVQPTPSTSVSPACTSSQLRAVGSMQGAAGSRDGAIVLTNLSGESCRVHGTPAITLLDQNLNAVNSGLSFGSSPPGWVVNGSPKPAGWPVVTLAPGDVASVRIGWSNWCHAGPAPLWRVTIPGGGTVDVINGMDSVSPPPCNGPGRPSTIAVGPFEPGAGS
jgi:hypothetical protein